MKEITIKAHTRRSKLGKTVKVKGYSRRVGRKGVHSPARKKGSGDEFSSRAETRNQESPSDERKVEIGPYAAENAKLLSERYDRLRRGKTAVYSAAAVKGEKYKEKKSTKKKPDNSWRDKMSFMERVEDKVANFVEKYSKKKYKRQV